MAAIGLRRVNKIYPNGFHAVKDVDIKCGDQEFAVLLGPSGCGKTTILRMIAGLEDITSGSLYIGDRLVNQVEAKDRDVAMVFQNYALYPHMTVYDNMAFALKLRKTSKPDIQKRVYEAAVMLNMEELLPLRPRQLSGGQMQRVALGRAMVREPQVFLLDEPLSNLDMQLRSQMREELIRMHKRLGTTFVYVTHDQMEAMTMATVVVVMEKGVVQQVGPPLEVYDQPANLFVAGFIGSPGMNFLEADLTDRNHLHIISTSLQIPVPENRITAGFRDHTGQRVVVGIRPEDIHCRMAPQPECGSGYTGAIVDRVERLGSESHLHLKLAQHQVTAKAPRDFSARPGDTIGISFDVHKIHAFSTATQQSLLHI